MKEDKRRKVITGADVAEFLNSMVNERDMKIKTAVSDRFVNKLKPETILALDHLFAGLSSKILETEKAESKRFLEGRGFKVIRCNTD